MQEKNIIKEKAQTKYTKYNNKKLQAQPNNKFRQEKNKRINRK